MSEYLLEDKEPNELLKEISPAVAKDFRANDRLREEKGKLDSECTHAFWIQRCSFCRGIMGSDCQHNYGPGMPMKELYTHFDKLVCTYELALKLQKMKVVQKSRFYWVHVLENNIISLRSSENVSLRGSRVAAAFTSSEMCRHLQRLPRGMVDAATWEYIGRNAHDPNRLARLYIKLTKEHDYNSF